MAELAQYRSTLALLLVSILTVAPLAHAAGWPDERAAGPFVCHADFSLTRQEPLLDELAQLQREMQAILGLGESREIVHLFLFEQKQTYQAYLKQHFPRVPARRALYIKGRGPGMVFAHQGLDFEEDVRHESTHAVLHATLSHVPLWLDEGLAEYFEVPRDKRPSENPHLATIAAMISVGQLPRLEALESLSDLDQMGRDEYRDAWAWVHFMLHGPPEAREELVRYLQDLQGDAEVGQLSDRLRRRLPDLNRRLVAHFAR
jgi:hypothetical protein